MHVVLDVRTTGRPGADLQNAWRARTLSAAWRDAGCRVTVLCDRELEPVANVDTVRLPALGALGLRVGALWSLPAQCRALEPDVFVGGCGVLPLGTGGRRVLVVDGLLRPPGPVDRVAAHVMLGAAVSTALHVVTPTQSLADGLRAAFPDAADRVMHVPPLWPMAPGSAEDLVKTGRVHLNGAGVAPGAYIAWHSAAAGERPQDVLEAFERLDGELGAHLALLGDAHAWEALVRRQAPRLLEDGRAVVVRDGGEAARWALWAGSACVVVAGGGVDALLTCLEPLALGVPVWAAGVADAWPGVRNTAGDVDGWTAVMHRALAPAEEVSIKRPAVEPSGPVPAAVCDDVIPLRSPWPPPTASAVDTLGTWTRLVTGAA